MSLNINEILPTSTLSTATPMSITTSEESTVHEVHYLLSDISSAGPTMQPENTFAIDTTTHTTPAPIAQKREYIHVPNSILPATRIHDIHALLELIARIKADNHVESNLQHIVDDLIHLGNLDRELFFYLATLGYIGYINVQCCCTPQPECNAVSSRNKKSQQLQPQLWEEMLAALHQTLHCTAIFTRNMIITQAWRPF